MLVVHCHEASSHLTQVGPPCPTPVKSSPILSQVSQARPPAFTQESGMFRQQKHPRTTFTDFTGDWTNKPEKSVPNRKMAL